MSVSWIGWGSMAASGYLMATANEAFTEDCETWPLLGSVPSSWDRCRPGPLVPTPIAARSARAAPRYARIQFSTVSPWNRSKSLTFAVTSVRLFIRATAAI